MSALRPKAARALALALALSAPVAAQADPGPIEARFACSPPTVEVGQPFELALVLEHDAATSVFRIGSTDLELDDTWVVFDERRELPERVDGAEDRRVTRRVWTIASLEPGPRSLAPLVTPLVSDERVASVDASGASVDVTSVLAEGEDAPRPPRGFPEGFGERIGAGGSSAKRNLLLVVLALWLAVAFLLWRRFRGRGSVRRSERVVPLDELTRLRGVAATDAESVRARHYALSRLVRSAASERAREVRASAPKGAGAGEPWAGLTDREWLAVVSSTGALAPDALDELERFFAGAEAVKYAGAVPTRWALDESFESARRVLELVRVDALDAEALRGSLDARGARVEGAA